MDFVKIDTLVLDNEIEDKELNEIDLAYKGFNTKLKCRNFQYSFNTKFKHNESSIGISIGGFHCCSNPFDVFFFYPPSTSRYCRVAISGRKCIEDRQQVAQEITLLNEFSLIEFIAEGAEKISELTSEECTYGMEENYIVSSALDDYTSILNNGHCSIGVNTGDYSSATCFGNRTISAITGDQSISVNHGNYSISASSGNRSVSISKGPFSCSVNSGHKSVSLSHGKDSISLNLGDDSNSTCMGRKSISISTGANSVSTADGLCSIAMASGVNSKAKATKGSAIVLVCRDEEGNLICIRSGIAGKDIKEDVWYALNVDGEFVEVQN